MHIDANVQTSARHDSSLHLWGKELSALIGGQVGPDGLWRCLQRLLHLSWLADLYLLRHLLPLLSGLQGVELGDLISGCATWLGSVGSYSTRCEAYQHCDAGAASRQLHSRHIGLAARHVSGQAVVPKTSAQSDQNPQGAPQSECHWLPERQQH